jgi:hypothetical protein
MQGAVPSGIFARSKTCVLAAAGGCVMDEKGRKKGRKKAHPQGTGLLPFAFIALRVAGHRVLQPTALISASR